MEKILFPSVILALAFTAGAAFAEVGVNMDIHLGNRPEPPPPVVVGPPAIIVSAPPEMVYVSSLGTYVAVGIPYDLLFVNNVYFYHANGLWYRSPGYGGPWVVAHRGLPPGLRKYRIERIREYREHAWVEYKEKGERFPGKHFLAKEHRMKEVHRENQKEKGRRR